MIISASRRTDIPAFYPLWFMNRVSEGYCVVPNPMNMKQVSRISLLGADVDCFVFWTRNAAPLIPSLAELRGRGYDFFFLYTLTGYPGSLEPAVPRREEAIDTIRTLAREIGRDRVIWRYDPLIFGSGIDEAFHERNFASLCSELGGSVHHCIISVVQMYRKNIKRFATLGNSGIYIAEPGEQGARCRSLIASMTGAAADRGIEIRSCSDTTGLREAGVLPGACIESAYISSVLGRKTTLRKDPSQREACGYVASRDIGMYDTCAHGCAYCYANVDFATTRVNMKKHDPSAPSLLPVNNT